MAHIECACLPVEQPIGTFFVGVINFDDLLSISFADVRRQEGREIERYIGTQRDLSAGRVAEIKQYVNTVDACFPTSIILAVAEKDAEYVKSKGVLRITKAENTAKIIDGQHRIAGLEGYKGNTFQLNVTIFVDMDIEDQAMVFATINLKQTRVTKSLAYDLFEYAHERSPQKTGHNIAKLLNFRDGSPLHLRIKILGKAEGEGAAFQVITQSTFVDRLLKMITRDAMADRDLIQRGKAVTVTEDDDQDLIFRRRFANDKDAEIARILWNYFEAVKARWPEGWEDVGQGKILARTTGFAALMRVLPPIWRDMKAPARIPSAKDFGSYFDRVNLEDSEFTSDNFKPGSTGEGQLTARLIEGMKLK